MRHLPPPHPKGAPRTPGSGRKRGVPNKATIEMRELLASICHDVSCQGRLREDFRRRRVARAIEGLAWQYTIGSKPVDRVQVAADVTMHPQLAEDRALFATLSLEDLQELANDSEQLMAKARRMARGQLGPPADAPVLAAKDGESQGARDE